MKRLHFPCPQHFPQLCPLGKRKRLHPDRCVVPNSHPGSGRYGSCPQSRRNPLYRETGRTSAQTYRGFAFFVHSGRTVSFSRRPLMCPTTSGPNLRIHRRLISRLATGRPLSAIGKCAPPFGCGLEAFIVCGSRQRIVRSWQLYLQL